MYSKFDKALVALIMAGFGVTNALGFHFGLDEQTVSVLVAVATPTLVALIPNLPKDTP